MRRGALPVGLRRGAGLRCGDGPNERRRRPGDVGARSARSIECSHKADAQNLHGKPRKHFMRECKHADERRLRAAREPVEGASRAIPRRFRLDRIYSTNPCGKSEFVYSDPSPAWIRDAACSFNPRLSRHRRRGVPPPSQGLRSDARPSTGCRASGTTPVFRRAMALRGARPPLQGRVDDPAEARRSTAPYKRTRPENL